MTEDFGSTQLRRLSTPRAAAAAGVLFAVLFAAALVLIRTTLPEHPQVGSDWVESGRDKIRIAAILIPFAGIAFLWFIGVVRDGFGHLEDKFFSTVFIGSGLLFLAMTFVASAVGVALSTGHLATPDSPARIEIEAFGQMLLLTLTKTYALRMAAVFMMSLATIWLKTSLMPRWLVLTTYGVVLAVILSADVSMWIALTFPAWVLVVSLFVLNRSGVIDLDPRDHDDARASNQT